MSLEQWGILALVILVPLLEGVVRLGRKSTSHPQNGGPGDQVAQTPVSRRWSSLPNRHADDDVPHAAEQTAIPQGLSLPPPPLPQPASAPVLSLARFLRATRPRPQGQPSREAQRRVQRPLRGDPVVRGLRPVRDLRRAIVLATILGPPSQ